MLVDFKLKNKYKLTGRSGESIRLLLRQFKASISAKLLDGPKLYYMETSHIMRSISFGSYQTDLMSFVRNNLYKIRVSDISGATSPMVESKYSSSDIDFINFICDAKAIKSDHTICNTDSVQAY